MLGSGGKSMTASVPMVFRTAVRDDRGRTAGVGHHKHSRVKSLIRGHSQFLSLNHHGEISILRRPGAIGPFDISYIFLKVLTRATRVLVWRFQSRHEGLVEMPVKITLTLEDKVGDAIAAAFDRVADRDAACQLFAELSVRHFHEWITGARRYRSLTEQHAAWIEDLYATMLPPTEGPSVDRLYNSFNMPYGQAAYIARTLADKLLAKWRKQALLDLRDDINIAWPTAEKHIKKNELDRVVIVRTSKLAARELQRLCGEIWRKDKSFVSPVPKGSLGEQRTLEIQADSLRMLRDTLKAAR